MSGKMIYKMVDKNGRQIVGKQIENGRQNDLQMLDKDGRQIVGKQLENGWQND